MSWPRITDWSGFLFQRQLARALDYLEGLGGGGGGAADTFETVAKNLSAVDAVLTFTSGNLTSVAYANGVTKTLNYTGDDLTSVVLSGATPGGIDLTKTLTYSGGDLADITYS